MTLPERLTVEDDELARYHPPDGSGGRARALLLHQRATWDLAARGYEGLERVEVRRLELDGYPFLLQHNPARLTSSSASVDDTSVRNRRCFLCAGHLPEGQKAVVPEPGWLLLVNPFPIFPEHFTIARTEHVVQRLAGSLGPMLRITRELGREYTLFYNGPRSGASAPDHMHFQAGSAGFMPVDAAAPALIARAGRAIPAARDVRLTVVTGVLRPFIALESGSAPALEDALERVLRVLPAEDGAEPMLNVIARWEAAWRVLVYPRRRHRPSFFFEEGERKILISPAAVDMGGVSILPRHEDFAKVRTEDLVRMFTEVCPDATLMESVARALAGPTG